MGLVKMSGVVKGVTEPVGIPAVFADATWEQVIEVCKTNTVPATWEVGDQKAMTIDGADYLIDIIGKNHDTYSDGSGTAPLTFQMHDCWGTKYYMNTTNSNQGSWRGCAMRTTYLPAIFNLLPSEVQAGIKEVNKLTSCGNQSTIIDNPTADKLFLLSEIEIYGTITFSLAGEGNQYAYYAAGNNTVKSVYNSATYWAQRSPNKNDSMNYCACDTFGLASYAGAFSTYNTQQGVAFAFCF